MFRRARCDVVRVGAEGEMSPASGCCDLEGIFLIRGSNRRSSPEFFLIPIVAPMLIPSKRDLLLPRVVDGRKDAWWSGVCTDTWEAISLMKDCNSSVNEDSGTNWDAL